MLGQCYYLIEIIYNVNKLTDELLAVEQFLKQVKRLVVQASKYRGNVLCFLCFKIREKHKVS